MQLFRASTVVVTAYTARDRMAGALLLRSVTHSLTTSTTTDLLRVSGGEITNTRAKAKENTAASNNAGHRVLDRRDQRTNPTCKNSRSS